MAQGSEEFRPAHGLALASIVGLSGCIIAFLAEIVFNVAFVLIFPNLAISDDPGGPELAFAFAALGIAALRLISYFGTVVVFLIWIYRAYKNLFAFDVPGLDATPGWAVGYWFVPVLSLFKPLGVVNEIYHFSDPANHAEQYGPVNNGSTLLTGVWWACWLVFLLLANVGQAFQRGTDAASSTGMLVEIASLAAGTVAAILLIQIIRSIDKGQSALAHTVVAAGTPPPPDVYFESGNT